MRNVCNRSRKTTNRRGEEMNITARYVGIVAVVMAIMLTWTGTATATDYVWTDGSGNHLWTNSANWSPSTGAPLTTGDTATFTNSTDASVTVDEDIAIGSLYLNQDPHVTNTITIASGKTFQPYYRQAYNLTATNTTIIEGGTFKPRTYGVIVGYQSSSAGSAQYPDMTLILTNTIFDTGNLTGASDGIMVGYNGWSIGSVVGKLDMRGADIRYNGVQNLLQVSRLWAGVRYNSPCNVGRIFLPPAITNITVSSLLMRGTATMDALIDLGQNPQLQTLKILSEAKIANGYIRYRDADGASQTNLPPDTELIIGASGSPAVFDFGVMYNTTMDIRWSGFRRFEGYLSQLNIGRSPNSMTVYAELDLASVGELAGDITTNNVDMGILRLGGGNRDGTGVLRLPGTVTNMVFDTFHLGNIPDLKHPPNSVLDLGSNTQLRAITVRDDFRIGRGEFQYVDSGGTPHTGLPGGVAFRAGAEDQRAGFRVGDCYTGAIAVFGPGLSTFDAWLSELWIGDHAAIWMGQPTTYSTLDLRGVVVTSLDVEGDVTMGIGYDDQSTFYLSSSAMRCSTLTIGNFGSTRVNDNAVSTLVLSNAVVTVTNSVTLNETALVEATLDGYCAGLNLQTTNLFVAEPFVTFPEYYGLIDLTFAADPLDTSANYYGLQLTGDARAQLQALTDAVPSRLTWNTDGLSPAKQASCGIHYDEGRDVTFVGLQGILSGTVIIVR